MIVEEIHPDENGHWVFKTKEQAQWMFDVHFNMLEEGTSGGFSFVTSDFACNCGYNDKRELLIWKEWRQDPEECVGITKEQFIEEIFKEKVISIVAHFDDEYLEERTNTTLEKELFNELHRQCEENKKHTGATFHVDDLVDMAVRYFLNNWTNPDDGEIIRSAMDE